jgi:serine/threonine protein phosphatase 1
VGDIHGRLDLLERMHELIEADAAKSQSERTVVVYVGDYVDRGPDSSGVVELLIRQPLRRRFSRTSVTRRLRIGRLRDRKSVV